MSAVEYWGKITEGNEEAMKCYIAKYGVLSVTITTQDTGIEHYSEGIFDDREGDCSADKPVDHVSSNCDFKWILTDFYQVKSIEKLQSFE